MNRVGPTINTNRHNSPAITRFISESRRIPALKPANTDQVASAVIPAIKMTCIIGLWPMLNRWSSPAFTC